MSARRRCVRILIVDEHPIMREALKLRLSQYPEYEVCGEADSEEAGLALTKREKPDLAIVEIALQNGSGLALIRRLKERCARTKILVLTGSDYRLYAERSLRAGALGYLNKDQTGDDLMVAVRSVLDNQRYVAPAVARRLVEQAFERSDMDPDGVESLSNRELEVFRRIGQGQTNSVIAQQLHLSTHTVDSHRENIKRKLGVSTGGELNRRAVQWVLENP